MKKIVIIPVIALLIGLLSNCTNTDLEAKNMEQLYKENGVPVKTEKVSKTSFRMEHAYHAELTGIEESSEYAAIADKIEKVHVKVGDYVKKDQVVLAFPTDNPAAQYVQSKLAFENAATSFKRIENLYQSGGISRQDLDNARTHFEVAQANWDAVRQSVMVKAPISGMVTKVNVRESDNVNPGDELFTVSQTGKMKAKLWVSENQINNFKTGLPASAIWNDVEIQGHVVQVDRSLNRDNQAFGVVVELDNPNKMPLCGITANVIVYTYTADQAVIIDRKNLVREEQQYFVYVVQQGKAEKREISVGNTYGLDVEILSGLNPGDVLITEGQMLLTQGAKVKVTS